MKKYLLFFFLFVSTLETISLYGYNIRQISNKEGLSNSAILSIYQDQKGYMWFGSVDGLNVFNGTNVNVYKSVDNKNNLSGNLIEDIIETENDVFWIRTNYGLNKLDYKKRRVEHFPSFTGYVLLEKDSDNRLFVIKDDGAIYYYIEQTGFKKVLVPDVLVSNIADFIIDESDKLWLICKNGKIISYTFTETVKNEISISIENKVNHNKDILFCSHEKNTIYFIDSSNTLYEYDLLHGTKEYIFDLTTEISRRGEVSSIVKQGNNYYIGFIRNGLVRLVNTPDRKDKFVFHPIEINSGVFCLYKDRHQELVWVGTDGQGVFAIFNAEYSVRSTTFNNNSLRLKKPVRALLIDKKNTLWIGTKGDGVVKLLDYKSEKNIDEANAKILSSTNTNLKNNSVYAFAKSKWNVLWIGHDEGINYYSYREKIIKNIELVYNGEPIKYIHSICEMNDSTLWLTSVGMGVIKAKITGNSDAPILKNVERFTILNGKQAFNHFFTAYAENDSNIWFGNRGYGAFRMDTRTKQMHSVQFDKALNNQLLNDVFSISKDQIGNLWFGTSLGLVKYSPSGIISIFNESFGFPNNTIHGILKDSKENLWLSTNNGIIRFDTRKEMFQTFDHSNGLSVTEFSDGAFSKDEVTGNLYFGGINGFVEIIETNEVSREYNPQILLYSLSIFGKEYNIHDFYSEKDNKHVLNLNYNQNFFSISISANDYINGNNYSFYYKLEGLNDQWVDNKNSKTISFTNIAPGTYLLAIKYLNRVTGEESASFPLMLNIRPPWYLSKLAYFAYIILMFACLFLLVNYYLRKNKKKRLLALEKIQQRHQEEVYESKLRFFTNIAHEFSTPLTLISGPCNRILTHKGSDGFVLQYTNLIQRNAERLNNLIQELIEFRRIETGDRTPHIEELSINELIQDITKLFIEKIESSNIILENDVKINLFWNSDRTFLYSILSNFISNALRNTNKRGTIRISAQEEEPFLKIIISNTGKGINEENIKKIFNRYNILESIEDEGDIDKSVFRNGLGLAISHNLVGLLDGDITIQSIPNEVTSFTIMLPHKDVTNETKQKFGLPEITLMKEYTTELTLPKYPFIPERKTVFIAEDDIEILWLISEVFAELNNVIPRGRITDVNQLFKDVYPDIIICDVLVDGVDGISLTKQVKMNKKTAHIPIILISAKHCIEEEIEGLNAGAEIYITKPFNVEHLKVSVKRLISRKEELKDYFSSPLSSFDLVDGKLTHIDDKNYLQKVLDIIDTNLKNESLSAQFVADLMGISTRHLYRKLNEIAGKSVVEMIKECRLNTAQNLLINTKMTVDEVMYSSGFNNRATFYKNFTEKFNCTPKEYRETNYEKMK